jgi:two-component system, NarL family, invasion response regulator UvrY
MVINVLIADDHSIVRAGLIRVIEECNDIKVIAEASSGNEAITKARSLKPDVAVLDISMPDLDGLEVLNYFKENLPEIPVIILTMHEEEQYVIRAIESGALGYITKRSAPEQLVKAIQQVHNGKRFLTDRAVEALALHVHQKSGKKTPLDTLSKRELQVLRRLALGSTNHEIADLFNISIKTVDTYRLRMLKKLNLRNNAELSLYAIKNDLIKP